MINYVRLLVDVDRTNGHFTHYFAIVYLEIGLIVMLEDTVPLPLPAICRAYGPH
jgi:hypothetical protein